MPTNPNPVTGLPLSGGTVASLTVSPGGLTYGSSAEFGINAVQTAGGTNSAAEAASAVITPANANGTAAQLTDTTRDYMVYLTVGTAGTALSVAIGPTSTPANTIYNAGTATAGQTIGFRLPAGWFWKWAATTATLALQSAIGC